MHLKAIVSAVSIVSMVVIVAASDKKIQMKDLPPAVQKAVEAETKGSTVKGFAKETEKGKTYYEVETTVDGRSRDLLFDPSGNLVEVEEELALDAAPAPVKAALTAKGKVLKLESVKKGDAVTYEAQVERNGKKSAVALDAAGKPIKP